MMKQRQIPTKQIQILTIQKLEDGRGAIQPLAAGEWALLALTALFLCALAFVHARPGVIAAETEAVIVTAAVPETVPAAEIPAEVAAVPETVTETVDTPADTPPVTETVPADTSTAAATPPTSAASDLLNVNTASADDLTALPGIGPVLAERIVAYRTEHGPFSTPDDLQNVKGIGPAKLAAIRDRVICG